MFWSGNFIVVRELNFLLKEENVTLSQVLEADDILQECKADNKALMQFLTRPDILAELITLITEEPPASVELAQQYRHASIACEVLTSPLSSLSDRLSLDTAQMNRLCDFINRDPPLNPLLASYFSKTIEMLLERNPKQDWYLYHIVCLRVMDFFKCRRDFLPNLLRHINTSAIADTFKFFIRLDDLFNKIVMEWFEEHQFMECLIQIVCGSYVGESGAGAGARGAGGSLEEPEKGQRETSEKHNHTDTTHTQDVPHDHENNECPEEPGVVARRRARIAAVAASNAAELLAELVASGCAAEGAATRSRTSWALLAKLAQGNGPSHLLQAVFTCGVESRATALTHGARLLRILLEHAHTVVGGCEGGGARAAVELAVAPHLPLLHQALLRDPATYSHEGSSEGAGGVGDAGGGAGGGAVGAARVETAALLAHLAASEVEEVATTMLTLGTPSVLTDMFFRYPHNNFLHATLVTYVRNALTNPAYRTQYTTHFLDECDLLTRLMDAFEENENKQSGAVRAGYMGHVTLVLARLASALAEQGAELAPALAPRWHAFTATKLEPTLQHFNQPLGGTYPSENTYEADTNTDDRLAAYYTTGGAGGADVGAEPELPHMMDDDEDQQYRETAKDRFLELAGQRFDDDMWDDAPEAEEAAPDALREVLADTSPWESGAGSEAPAAGAGGETGWAQFEAAGGALSPADPFAPFQASFPHYWPYQPDTTPGGGELESLHGGGGTLATHLLTAMSGMSPAALATLVNHNLTLDLPPHVHTDGEITATVPVEATPIEGVVPIPADTTQELPSEQPDIPPPHDEGQDTKPVTDTEKVKDDKVSDDKVADTSEPVTVNDTPVGGTHGTLTDIPTEITDSTSVSTNSPQIVTNLSNQESCESEQVPVPLPAHSPNEEFPGSSGAPPALESKQLSDVTEQLSDISLEEQKAECSPPATPPADTAFSDSGNSESAEQAER